MSKQPKLFDVPKDSPSHKQRLESFKKKHAIETHCSGVRHGSKDFMPWCALHMPTARTFGYGITDQSDLFDCISKICRLLDDAGVIGYGMTERDAIKNACEAVSLECDL